jgi:hypothetical protein
MLVAPRRRRQSLIPIGRHFHCYLLKFPRRAAPRAVALRGPGAPGHLRVTDNLDLTSYIADDVVSHRLI